jgi:hypothetical protein
MRSDKPPPSFAQDLLPILLPLVGIKVAIVGTLWVRKMTLRSSLLMMRILLRSHSTTNPGTYTTTTESVGAVVSLTLWPSLTTLTCALTLRLALTRSTLYRPPTTTTDADPCFFLILVSSLWRTCVTRTRSGDATCTARLSTKSYESLTGTSIQLFTIVSGTNGNVGLTET